MIISTPTSPKKIKPARMQNDVGWRGSSPWAKQPVSNLNSNVSVEAKFKYDQGIHELKAGRPIEARRCFKKTIEIDHQFADAYYQMGRIFGEEFRPELAQRFYNMTLIHDKNHLGARYKLGLSNEGETESLNLDSQDEDCLGSETSDSNGPDGMRFSIDIPEEVLRPGFWSTPEVSQNRFENLLKGVTVVAQHLVPAATFGIFLGMGAVAMDLAGFTSITIGSGGIMVVGQIIQRYL